VPAIGDAALVALAQHCSASLEHLDVSWCRAVSEDGLGHLVDACPRLSCLHVWGCTQITDRFHDGHSRHAMRVVGRGLAR
jgi:DNA repair protein RAD7